MERTKFTLEEERIPRRLADLVPPTRFYPGHGPDSTIEDQGWMLRLGWGI